MTTVRSCLTSTAGYPQGWQARSYSTTSPYSRSMDFISPIVSYNVAGSRYWNRIWFWFWLGCSIMWLRKDLLWSWNCACLLDILIAQLQSCIHLSYFEKLDVWVKRANTIICKVKELTLIIRSIFVCFKGTLTFIYAWVFACKATYRIRIPLLSYSLNEHHNGVTH